MTHSDELKREVERAKDEEEDESDDHPEHQHACHYCGDGDCYVDESVLSWTVGGDALCSECGGMRGVCAAPCKLAKDEEE